MMRSISYRPNKKVKIISGLYYGEIGIIDEISKDEKSIKLVGRGWYPRKMLRVVSKTKL